MHRYSIVFALVFGCLCLPVLAQEPEVEADDEAQVQTPSRWMLPDNRMLGDNQTRFSDGTVVDWGNPRWGRWAGQNASRVQRLSSRDLMIWLSVCANYRVEAAHRNLMRMAKHAARKRMGPTDTFGTLTAAGYLGLRARMFAACAMTANDRSQRDLHELMQFESRVQNAGALGADYTDHIARGYCAAGLMMLDDDRGRDFLIDGYREYLIALDQSPGVRAECRDILEGIYDAKLIERIEALREDPQITDQKAHNNIRGLLEKMVMNGKSPEQLLAIIREPGDGFNQRGRRNNALHAMALAGAPDNIADLEALDLGDDRDTNLLRDRAIEQIGCRHWQERR